MAQSTIWWILAGGAVALELLSGTFYLLMLALGLSAAALAAQAGAGTVVQLLVAAGVGGGAVTGWRMVRKRRAVNLPAGSNRDVNLDVGESVQVDAWNPDGTATVKYRGAQWTVMHRAGQVPSTGAHSVVEVIGSRLVVEKK
jgi:membrane protein implicated in regulation of membrane protease activity